MAGEEELFEQLVKKALDGEHEKLGYVTSLESCAALLEYISACKSTAKTFKGIADKMYAEYLKQIDEDSQDWELLMALKRFRLCERYYDEEVRLAKDSIKEYKAYVFGGHLLSTLAGKPRAESDMVDYREVPWTWF